MRALWLGRTGAYGLYKTHPLLHHLVADVKSRDNKLFNSASDRLLRRRVRQTLSDQ